MATTHSRLVAVAAASIALGSAASGQRSRADGADPAIWSAENRATNGRRARDSCGIKTSQPPRRRLCTATTLYGIVQKFAHTARMCIP
jgi:hypothetical protein